MQTNTIISYLETTIDRICLLGEAFIIGTNSTPILTGVLFISYNYVGIKILLFAFVLQSVLTNGLKHTESKIFFLLN